MEEKITLFEFFFIKSKAFKDFKQAWKGTHIKIKSEDFPIKMVPWDWNEQLTIYLENKIGENVSD